MTDSNGHFIQTQTEANSGLEVALKGERDELGASSGDGRWDVGLGRWTGVGGLCWWAGGIRVGGWRSGVWLLCALQELSRSLLLKLTPLLLSALRTPAPGPQPQYLPAPSHLQPSPAHLILLSPAPPAPPCITWGPFNSQVHWNWHCPKFTWPPETFHI